MAWRRARDNGGASGEDPLITLRLGHSLVAALYVVAGAMVCAASTFAAVALPSWPAAIVAAVSGVLVVRLGWVLLRRRMPASPQEIVVQGGVRGGAAAGPAFLVFARHSTSTWSQSGVVMVADHGAIFLPLEPRRHLLFGALQVMFAPRVRFADVSFPLGGATPDAMADAAQRRGGFVVGPDWTWNAAQRWLYRDRPDGIVVLAHAPPEGRMRPFRLAPPLAEADIRRGIVVISVVAAVLCGLLLTAGALGAWWTGDREILAGFVGYAVLVAVAAVATGVVLRRRHG